MAISFNSVGHLFAKFWTAVKADEPKVEAVLTKVEGAEPIVEGVTVAAGGSVVVPVEKVAFSVLGEISAILAASDAAAKAKLTDAGLDINVVTQVENLLKTAPHIVTLAKAVGSTPAAPPVA